MTRQENDGENGGAAARDARSAIGDYVRRPFGTLAELVRLQSAARPDHVAVVDATATIRYEAFDALVDRVAAALQRDGLGSAGVVAICASNSICYAAVFVGAIRAGLTVALLPATATPQQIASMLADSGAALVFADEAAPTPSFAGSSARRIPLAGETGGIAFAGWLAPDGDRPEPVEVAPEQAFNIVYSSGTTGTPKGIVQPYSMRWPHNHLADPPGYGPDAVALISTPLCSNTTLVSFIPALSGGGTAVLMPQFDPLRFLELCERHRVTHAMLVPTQYRRILDVPEFDRFDLSSFVLKYATAAPFAAALKAEVLRRWPGGLIEYFGMSEGGASCVLVAHEHPDKLATVGRPMPGHDLRVIDDDGRELPCGEVGEVVGRSPAMMTGYHNQERATAEATWISPAGERFIRSGDLARIDADGFVTLVGRSKDVINSGGANIFPVDLEAVLLEHGAVREAAVVGVPSARWGETPVGFVVLRGGADLSGPTLRDWANERLGRMQRLSDVRIVAELPRNALGKVLRRALRDGVAAART